MSSDYVRRHLFSASGGVVGLILDVVPGVDGVMPEWLVVDPGVMRPHRLVPARLVDRAHGKLTAPITVEQLESCPVEADGRAIDARTKDLLERHYGLVPGLPSSLRVSAG